jgi:polysaccharide biosynthesis transport protein
MNPQHKDFLYFLSFLKRRKWQILVPTALMLALTAGIIKALPPTYRSTATILIEEQEIPAELVGSTFSSFADQRIQVVSRQVMTRANLKQIIEKFDLYGGRSKGNPSEGVVERVRRNINLELLSAEVTDKRSGNKTTATIAFVLSYSGESAEQAQKVTAELVSLYLSGNLKDRQQKTADTERFLRQEATRLEAQIAEIELNLARFKERNAGKLPEQAQVNLQLRERSEAEILEGDRQISALLQRKADIETQLAQVKPYVPAVSASGERVLDSSERLRLARAQYESLVGIYSAAHPDVQRLRQEIEGLQRQLSPAKIDSPQAQEAQRLRGELASLRERYSEEHPDIIKTKTRLAELASLAATSVPVAPVSVLQASPADNPVYLALRGQVSATQAEMNAIRLRQNQLRAKLADYERRLRDTPQAEREYMDITRERENATRRYQEVKAKLMEAQVAQTLEKDNKSEQFSLIEPPDLPEKPIRPNRVALALLGFALSLGGGLAYGGIREAMDRTIHDASHLAATLRSPVLASIPEFAAHGATGSTRRLRYAFTALLMLALCLVLVHWFVSPIGSLLPALTHKISVGSMPCIG